MSVKLKVTSRSFRSLKEDVTPKTLAQMLQIPVVQMHMAHIKSETTLKKTFRGFQCLKGKLAPLQTLY